MREVSKNKKKEIQEEILAFYEKNKREFAWRQTTNPYHILLSEVMLQQTQTTRVQTYYNIFLKEFPKLPNLAFCPKDKLLRLWQGLGYNNRVLRLQTCCKEILEKQKTNPIFFTEKEIPKEEELLKLSGIGPYTARAILAFAYNQEVPVIDTNIRRILLSKLALPIDTKTPELEYYAKELIPKGRSRIWHNAVMDYAALELTARKSGISPLTKQSKFEGSTRQIRSIILKHLLENKSEKKEKLYKLLPQREDLQEILMKMEKDKLLRLCEDSVELAK
ncbi:MAG: Fe-S cluster assembly protein HesB [Candidatus Woesearchaeota archaeon]|nr:Fe-S cluster assembly protein HesB [Nanoarchaeota archaeon]USN44370.1 MAG: Fe-S cluster assembly protein HesB [Candidatus Woesearchaeota archaeon]